MRVFVTGASGWIGSAVVPELIAAGHEVVGLARSDASAATISAAGGEVHRGDLDDLDGMRRAADASDGVIHLAFRHDLSFTGNIERAAAVDRRAIEIFGEVLAGSDRPFVIASGLLGVVSGRTATELDGHGSAPIATPRPSPRSLNAELTLGLAARGVRSSIVRLPPTVHGDGDKGFVAMLVRIARDQRVSGYVGEGTKRWPAVHRLDAARLFRLALETAPAGSTLHAVGDQGVHLRAVAEAIGRLVEVPVRTISVEEAPGHFGFLAPLLAIDSTASSEVTRQLLGWQPVRPGLIEDIEEGHYLKNLMSAAT